MKITIAQKEKDLFRASFDILRNEKVVGNISMKGELSSLDLDVDADFDGKKIKMFYEGGFYYKKDGSWRPYKILVDGKEYGEIFTAKFKKFLHSYEYLKLVNNKAEYEAYIIGIGKKTEVCVYQNGNQVFQDEKDGKIINDLHVYDNYMYEEKYALDAILLSIYIYIIYGYKPGEKVIKSIVKSYNKTTNKYLLEKYDENWVKNIPEWKNKNSRAD